MRRNQDPPSAAPPGGAPGPVDELENLRIRVELMAQVTRLIRERRLTQTGAAKILRVSQPRVSDLVRGKADRFSIDALVTMLGHAGEEVSIVVRPRQKVA
jgi:predicted XRE-type DNA-binding protein